MRRGVEGDGGIRRKEEGRRGLAEIVDVEVEGAKRNRAFVVRYAFTASVAATRTTSRTSARSRNARDNNCSIDVADVGVRTCVEGVRDFEAANNTGIEDRITTESASRTSDRPRSDRAASRILSTG